MLVLLIGGRGRFRPSMALPSDPAKSLCGSPDEAKAANPYSLHRYIYIAKEPFLNVQQVENSLKLLPRKTEVTVF